MRHIKAAQKWQRQLDGCHARGREAYRQGKLLNENPYRGATGVQIQRHAAWLAGWLREQRLRALRRTAEKAQVTI